MVRLSTVDGYFTIVLTELNANTHEIVQQILKQCWDVYITNVVVISIDQNAGKCALYTYFPFTENYCEQVIPVIYNHFINETLSLEVISKELFPMKLKNMFGCPITVATFHRKPNMNLNDPELYPSGIDGILLLVISKHMHFKLNIMVPPGLDADTTYSYATRTAAVNLVFFTIRINDFFRIFATFSLSRQVLDGVANLTIGGYAYKADRTNNFTASNTYYYADISLAISNPLPYTAVQQLLFPFSNTVWCCVVVTFMIGIMAICCLKLLAKKKHQIFVFGTHNSMPTINMLNVCLGGGVSPLPQRNFARYLLAIWLMGSLVLRNSYQGALFKFLRTPKSRPLPKAVTELIANNYTFYMTGTNFFENLPINDIV